MLGYKRFGNRAIRNVTFYFYQGRITRDTRRSMSIYSPVVFFVGVFFFLFFIGLPD